MDSAASAGFAVGPMETHETAAVATIILFMLHTLIRLLTIWRRYQLSGVRGWLAELTGLTGIAGLLATAYLGGRLAYHMGVHVTAAVHRSSIAVCHAW